VAAPGSREARVARWLRPGAWAAGLVPLALLLYAGFTDGLTAEPVEFVTHRTGFAAILLLMATLAVTPLRRLTGWNVLAPVRRTLGLCAFLYACLHLVTYLFDQGLFFPGEFALGYIWEDVAERLYVTVGFTAFLLLIPLALTSTRASIRRLGKRWQKLHRLVYIAAGLGVLHWIWLVKKDLRDPLIVAAVFALLMLLRLPGVLSRRRPAARRPRAETPLRAAP